MRKRSSSARPDRSLRLRSGERVADLAEDLGLTEDERVQPCRDAAEVSRDVFAGVDVEVVDEQLTRNLVRIREGVDELVPRVLDAGGQARVELDAVARLQRSVLGDRRAALDPCAERSEALAQLDGSCPVAEPQADETVHV